MGLYLAHTAEDGRTQTVLQHLTGTAKRCAAFADTFHAPEQGQLAGSAHDVGKYSDAFQRRLLHDGPKVDHATAGAFECLKLGQLFAAFAVAGHHGGLPDGGGRGDGPDAGTFFGRINRAAQGKLDDYSAWKAELTLPRAPPAGLSAKGQAGRHVLHPDAVLLPGGCGLYRYRRIHGRTEPRLRRHDVHGASVGAVTDIHIRLVPA